MKQQVNTGQPTPVFKALLEYDDSVEVSGSADLLPGTYIGKGKGKLKANG